LIDEGTLETITLPQEPAALACDPAFARPSLEAAQENAASILMECVQARAFSVTLLEGVTGSGKTEVYFEAVASALEAGRQSLILMPEIALTAQFLGRFASRFGARPGEWHSGVSARKRARLWSAAAQGEVKVVIGARSALFLPFADLATLIVDEEHEAAYKQEEGAAYHARDMAVVRGQIEKAAVVLVSATPSIESRVNAANGRYTHLRLAARFKAKALPAIAAIDLRAEAAPRGKWISPRLVEAISKALARGEQALLFLNRRGLRAHDPGRHRPACRNSATISALFAFSLASNVSGGLAGALSARLPPFRPTQTPLLAASLMMVAALKGRPPNRRLPYRLSHRLWLRFHYEGDHDSRRGSTFLV
jgi:primosomal protein N' (replication factor Y) (superfamily II helicase)